MAGSTPRKAVQNFLKPLQPALSCVTDAQIATTGDCSMTTAHAWVVAGGEPFPLPRAREASLRARLSQNYRIARAEGQRGPWKLKIACHYTLEESDGREVISFQWHPTGPGALPYPHVHLGAAAEVWSD